MAIINIGGGTVEVPDDLDPTKGPAQTLRNNAFGDAAAQTTNPRTVAPQIATEPIAQNPGMTGNPANNDLLRAAQQRVDPVQTAARNAAWPQTPQAAPTASPAIGPNNPAFHGDGRYGAPPNPVAEAPAAGRTSLRAGVGAAEGTLGKAGYAVGRGVQAVATSPVGGIVKGALNSAAIGGGIVMGHFNDYKLKDPGVDSSLGGTMRAFIQDKKDQLAAAPGTPEHEFTTLPKTRASLGKGLLETGMDLGSAVADTADYLVPGKAPVSTWYNNKLRETFGDQLQPHASVEQQGAQGARAVAAGVKPIPADFRRGAYDDPRRVDLDPSRQSLGASRDFTGELAGVPGRLPNDLRQGAITKTMGANGRPVYSGANIAGDAQTVDGMGRELRGGGTVSMMGGQPGDATPEQRLAQIHRDSAHMAEMNAMRQQLSDGANPMAGVSGLIGSGGYGGARTPEQLARDAAVSASSITNTQGISSREAARLKREDARMLLEARRNDQNNDTLRRGQDITGRGQELQHSATLRGQDITGRGQNMTYDAAMYGHNVDLQGKMAPSEMKKAQMQRARMILNHPSVAGDMGRASALAAQTGDTELANALLAQAKDAQTLGHNASTNADRASESFATATDKDGKGYIDPAKLATARTLRQNIAPGYDQMSESQRAVAKPVVDAGQNIVMGMNKVDRPTFAQMIRWDGPSPQLTTVPDLRDAKVDYVGALDHESLIPGNNIRRGDVRMQLRDGTTRYIPREHYNANEMDIVKRHSGNKN